MSEHSEVHLPNKANAAIAMTFTPAEPPAENGRHNDIFVVFLNGLVLPRASWFDAIRHLTETRKETGLATPAMLCYDRFGQGDSDPDPMDPPDTPYGHDALSIVEDLHQLLMCVSKTRLGRDIATLRLVLVGNSIGCALARLYAAAHPDSAVGFLFLDSMIANSDFVSLIPDPDSRNFDPSDLPADVTPADLRHARAMVGKYFHPTVGNPEHFDRRGLASLLPRADTPALPGMMPRLVVIGHDPQVFAESCETVSFPPWHGFNLGNTGGIPCCSKGCPSALLIVN